MQNYSVLANGGTPKTRFNKNVIFFILRAKQLDMLFYISLLDYIFNLAVFFKK